MLWQQHTLSFHSAHMRRRAYLLYRDIEHAAHVTLAVARQTDCRTIGMDFWSSTAQILYILFEERERVDVVFARLVNAD